MLTKTKVIMLVIMVAAGCVTKFPVRAQNLSGTVNKTPSEFFDNCGWGRVDCDSINDYLAGIERHYSEGIVVGLGEYHDDVELDRYGRRFPVIILSSTGDGNLADCFYYFYYGFHGNRNLETLCFDDCLYIISAGSIYRIHARETIFLDPAFGRPTYPHLNHTLSDFSSFEFIEMYDSHGCAALGIQFHDLRYFRGLFNAIREKFSWRDHEGPVQFRDLGFDLKGNNKECQIIDEPNWETRFYKYCAESDSWIHIMTLPGIGYPEDWSICTGMASQCEDSGCTIIKNPFAPFDPILYHCDSRPCGGNHVY